MSRNHSDLTSATRGEGERERGGVGRGKEKIREGKSHAERIVREGERGEGDHGEAL